MAARSARLRVMGAVRIRPVLRLAALLLASVVFLLAPLGSASASNSGVTHGVFPSSVGSSHFPDSGHSHSQPGACFADCSEDMDSEESDSREEPEQDLICHLGETTHSPSSFEIFSVIRCLGFALDRPAAVHRPPWV